MQRDARPNIDFDDRPQDNYSGYLLSLKNHFLKVTKEGGEKLFTTNATGLFDIFLDNLPADARQHYECNTCRHFVNKYGNLVTISEKGNITSAVFGGDVPEFFKHAVNAAREKVISSKVVGVFITKDAILGTPQTGTWEHMSARVPSTMVAVSRLKSAGQLMSEKREEFNMLVNACKEYDIETIKRAINLLESESVYRGDKCIEIAKWFDQRKAEFDKHHTNLLWRAVANAPVGFCHIKSGMIGTLLDDLEEGYSLESVASRFKAKMSTYMRSQVAPTQGNIDQAEKIVAELGIASSLRRRYARLDELKEFVWTPRANHITEVKRNESKVFGSIVPREKSLAQEIYGGQEGYPHSIMTWDKFQRTVLPSALSIEAKIENTSRFMALVTAYDDESENILQWDNPFSWYYHGGIDGEIRRRVEEAGGRYENNEIRCSLIWEGYTDLDIHCVTPTGTHIYYSNKRDGYSDGYLDVDANGGHADTSKPVENIRWSVNAPQGRYRFYVHNFQERGVGRTPFKVELEVNGKIHTYEGVASSTGFKEDIFYFDYQRGKDVQINRPNVSTSFSGSAWGLQTGEYVKVKGIAKSPNLWGNNNNIQSGDHTFFLLEGCKDDSEGKGRGFFNEILKSELREVRKTLEAYCANSPIDGVEDATACGLGFAKDNEWNLTLKVATDSGIKVIKIDRFD